jgi:hypothetical protein
MMNRRLLAYSIRSSTDEKLPAADLLMRYKTGIWRQIDRLIERIQHWRRLGDSSSQTGRLKGRRSRGRESEKGGQGSDVWVGRQV